MNNERLSVIDKLRVISMFGVILIHTTTKVLESTSYNLTVYSWTLFLNQIVRFSVPLFFFISGFVLELSAVSKLSYLDYIKKRLSKIAIPYIFWSLIYYYFIFNQNQSNLVKMFLSGDASYQLYFIPALFIFYLMFPILHKFYKVISMPISLAVLATLQIWFLHQDYFIKDLPYLDPVRISILGFFFFIIGMVASHYKESIINFSKKWRVPIVVLFIALGYYVFDEGLSRYQALYNIHTFYSSWRPSTFAYTFVSAAFFLTLVDKVNFHKLSKLSFLVFFIHIIVLEFVWKYIGSFVTPNFYFDILFFAIVTGISFEIASLLHKIPRISKVIG